MKRGKQNRARRSPPKTELDVAYLQRRTTTGPSLIWSARRGIFGLYPFPTGSRSRLIPGLHPLG